MPNKTRVQRKRIEEASRQLSTEAIRWSDASEWLLPPQQARSLDTLRRVLEAAIGLFSKLGYAQTTIAAISKASGVSTGSIYGRFEDKEAILNTVMHAYYRSRLEQFDALFSIEACRDFDLAKLVTYYTDLLLASFRQDGALILLADAQRTTNENIARQVNELNNHVASRFAEVLSHHAENIRQPDIRGAAMLYHDLVCCLARIAIQPTGPVASDFSLNNPSSRHRVIGMFLDHLQMTEISPVT